MLSVIAALSANILVAISKFVGFILSGSAAMLNESIHSVVDCSNQILLLVGDKQARKPASALHPFGQARAKYFYSVIVAMLLFFGGGALGTMEAMQKLFHPAHTIENTWLVLGILVVGMVIEGSSLAIAFKEIKQLNVDHLPLFKFLKESRHSEIIIIFAEDSCAIIGLLLAFVGTGLSHITGDGVYDALAGVLIGVLLCLAAFFLAREFYSLLIGESGVKRDLDKMKVSFKREDIARLIDLKTIHLSPTDILLAAKVEIKQDASTRPSEIINDIERHIRADFPQYKIYIYIEEDRYQEHYQDHGLQPADVVQE